MELTELELQLLAFEESHPQHTRAKEDLLRREFGLTSARYYQTLSTLIDTPAALRANPQLVRRLQQRRDEMRARRFGTSVRIAQ